MPGSIKKRIACIFAALIMYGFFLVAMDADHVQYITFNLTGKVSPESDKIQIETTVKGYNKILTDFYSSGGMPMLIDTFPATKLLKHEIFRDLGYLKRAEKILVYDMATFTPFEIKLTGPGRAVGRFFEEWNFAYQAKDRKFITKPVGFGKGFRYSLVKEQGQWLVNDWDPDPDMPDLSVKEFKF